jgi:Helix-turn-helix domain
MQYENRSRQVTIRDPRAAKVFTHSHLRRILLQFARRPRSIAELARELAIDLKQLHHVVTKLCRLGLVEVVEERKRAGRVIKLYRCTGDRFFIPTAVAPAPFSRGLANELQDAIARDAAATVEGMEFWLDTNGRVSGRAINLRGATFTPLDSWRILRLSAARATQLKQELGKVLDRFQTDGESRGNVYLAHIGMARRPDHSGATDNPVPPAKMK